MHHHIENIIVSCLESKNVPLVEHLIRECNLVAKIVDAEKNFMLPTDSKVPYFSQVHDLTFITIMYFVFKYADDECIEHVFFFVQPTTPADGSSPPKIGNLGHLTRISNKLIQIASTNNDIQACLQVDFIFY